MSRFGWPSLLALAAIGCVTDNELTSKDDPTTEFDSGGDWQPPQDTADTDIDTDSGGGTVMPDYCDERSFAAEAVAQDADCEGGPRQPDWNLEVLWEKQVGSGTYSPAVVGQITDDNSDGVVDDSDVPDVVVFDSSAVLWVVSAEDGSSEWQATLSNSMNQLSAIGDVDGDGLPNVVADSNYTVTAYDNEGRVVWTGPSSYGKNKGTCGAFGMADLDADGSAEVYHGSRIIDGTNGDVRGNGTEGDGLGVGNSYGHSIAADLDGDGVWEVVVGNAAYDPDGNSIWANGEADGTVAVADLDKDGSPEVVSVGNYGVYTMDANGNVLWTFDLGGGLATTPAIADIDGDTYPEALIATTTDLFVLDMNGNEVMSIEAPGSGSGRGGVSAYDFDGNGTWEIVWQSPSALLIIDGKTGDTLADYSLTAPTCAGPVPIVDADNDGDADIVTYDSGGKIRVLTDSAGFTQARPVWHQSDYSLTNIGDNSEMPEDPVPNWQGANNFRAGAPVEQINSLYPVLRDVCADECEGGSVWVWYSVANNGYYTVNDRLAVEFWGVTDAGYTLLGEATWSGTVDAGMMTEADFIQLTGVATPLYDIDVRISGTTEDYEDCDESDDIDKWGTQICN